MRSTDQVLQNLRAVPAVPGNEREFFVGTSELSGRKADVYHVRDCQRTVFDCVSDGPHRRRPAASSQTVLHHTIWPWSVGEYVGRHLARLGLHH